MVNQSAAVGKWPVGHVPLGSGFAPSGGGTQHNQSATTTITINALKAPLIVQLIRLIAGTVGNFLYPFIGLFGFTNQGGGVTLSALVNVKRVQLKLFNFILVLLGSPSYSASPVHFDGNTYLSKVSLTGTDNGLASVSFWFYLEKDIATTLFVSDSALFETDAYINPGLFNLYFGQSTPAYIGFNNSITKNTWHHILVSATTSGTIMAAYLDNIQIPSSSITVFGSLTSLFQTAQDFYIGSFGSSGGQHLYGSLADFWFAPGTSLLDGTGNIPLATRRQFIDAFGYPVNPSSFPAGGLVLFDGNAANWATNQGSGGAFTITGTLTDSTTTGTVSLYPVAVVIKQVNKILNSVITSVAIFARLFFKGVLPIFHVTTTFAFLQRNLNKFVNYSVSLIFSPFKMINYPISFAFSSVANVIKQVSKAFISFITSVGIAIKNAQKTFNDTISLTFSSIMKQANKVRNSVATLVLSPLNTKIINFIETFTIVATSTKTLLVNKFLSFFATLTAFAAEVKSTGGHTFAALASVSITSTLVGKFVNKTLSFIISAPTQNLSRIFNGTTDLIDCGTGVNNGTSITFSAWVNIPSFTFPNSSGNYIAILGRNDVSSLGNYILYVKSNGKLAVYCQGVSYDGTGTYTLSTNTWYHLLVTYDSVNGINGYINGLLDSNVGTNGALSTSRPGHFQIGADASNPLSYNTNAAITDPAAWNGVLTGTQINNLVAGKRASTVGGTLIINLPILGQSPEPDQSGNSNNGVLTGTTVGVGPPLFGALLSANISKLLTRFIPIVQSMTVSSPFFQKTVKKVIQTYLWFTNVYWNVTNATSGLTFSNGNLTVAASGVLTSTGQTATGIIPIYTNPNTNGKYYWEVVVNTAPAGAGSGDPNNEMGIGFTDMTFVPGQTYLGGDVHSVGFYDSGQLIVNGSVIATLLSSFGTNGDVVQIAVDTINNLFWMRTNNGSWNTNPSSNPSTGAFPLSLTGGGFLGGTLLPAFCFRNTNSSWQITGAFAASSWSHPVPTGFLPVPVGQSLTQRTTTKTWTFVSSVLTQTNKAILQSALIFHMLSKASITLIKVKLLSFTTFVSMTSNLFKSINRTLNFFVNNVVNITRKVGKFVVPGSDARNFNGTSDKIALPNIKPSLGPNITVSAWVNPSIANIASYGTIFSCGASTDGLQYYIRNDGKLTLECTQGTYDGTGINTLTSNTWYHILATAGTSQQGTIYINGSFDGTVGSSGAITYTGTTFQIGTDPNNLWMGGAMADIAVWNTILTPTQIVDLASGRRANTIGANANLIDYLPIVGQSPEPDSSGNSNNGTVTGTTIVSGPPLLNTSIAIWNTTLSRMTGKVSSFTFNSIATTLRNLGKGLVASVVLTTNNVIKAINKTALNAKITLTASFSTLKVHLLTKTMGATATALINRSLSYIVQSIMTLTASVPLKTFAQSALVQGVVATISNITKNISTHKSFSMTLTATNFAQKVFLKLLTFSLISAFKFTRTLSVIRAEFINNTTNLQKAITHTITQGVTGTFSTIKNVARSLNIAHVSSLFTYSRNTGKTFVLSIQSSFTLVRKFIAKISVFTVNSIITFNNFIKKTTNFSINNTLMKLSTVNKNFRSSVISSISIFFGNLRFKLIIFVITPIVSISTFFSHSFAHFYSALMTVPVSSSFFGTWLNMFKRIFGKFIDPSKDKGPTGKFRKDQ